jgi:plastocyanin
MRQSYSFPALRSAPVALLILAACGGDTDQADRAPATEPVVIEDPGTITGHIAFSGAVPAPITIDMRDEPTCAERFDPDYPQAQPVSVEDGNLRNVFVYISDGLTGSFPAPDDAVVIDQRACIYTPRVAGVQTGQQLVFRNSDDLLHNIRATPNVNRGFNISQPRNMDSPRTFASREVMIPIECNVHGWMHAYVGVLDHPYFAVSDGDGSFRIANVPPGTYTIETWHERYGTQTEQITVGPNETVELTFAYDAAMAGRPVPLGPPLDPHDHTAVASAHDHR